MPEIDRQDELKRESMKRLRAAIPTEQFIDRPEVESDKGVDLILEAVIHRQPTNLRSHIQLKSTDKTTFKADGSFALSIETDNLRHLLDGPCPIYVLWLSAGNELRYAWARDEAKRLHSELPNWEQQGTVTISFAKRLDTEAWNAIHCRMIAEGRAACTIHNYFATVGSTESANFAINPNTMDVLTPQDALSIVKTHGIAATSNGYPVVVRRCSQLLSNEQLNDPCVQLSIGYACYSLGEHYSCRGHLARVLPHRDSLPEFEKFFLDSLLNECKLRFGQISDEEYTSAQRDVEANAPPFLALQLRLERIRWEHLSEHDSHRRIECYKALSDAESEIQNSPGASESIRLQAAIIRLNAEIVDANIGYVEAVVAMSARIQMQKNPLTSHLTKLFEVATAAEVRVASETEKLVQRAHSTCNPLLLAEAIVTQCIYRNGQIMQKPILLKLITGQQKVIPAEMVNLVLSQLAQAVSIFRNAGSVESTVRATLMQAQLLSSQGQHDAAKALVDSIMGTALGMEYTHYVKEGAAILSRTTATDKFLETLKGPFDPDVYAAGQDDDDVAGFARFQMQMNGLPEEQFPVIHRVALVMREESKTRVEWCRHFKLTVDEAHSEILPTNFATDPSFFAVCRKLPYRTYVPSIDAGEVTSRFKDRYCSICTDREPKR